MRRIRTVHGVKREAAVALAHGDTAIGAVHQNGGPGAGRELAPDERTDPARTTSVTASERARPAWPELVLLGQRGVTGRVAHLTATRMASNSDACCEFALAGSAVAPVIAGCNRVAVCSCGQADPHARGIAG